MSQTVPCSRIRLELATPFALYMRAIYSYACNLRAGLPSEGRKRVAFPGQVTLLCLGEYRVQAPLLTEGGHTYAVASDSAIHQASRLSRMPASG